MPDLSFQSFQCVGLVETLPATDYGFIVDQQPLGAKLFRQFCADTHKEYHRYNYFLDAVETYELELEDTRVKSASNIIKVINVANHMSPSF